MRLSRKVIESHTSWSPQKLSRSVLLNDSGSDMFRVVSERKETSTQLKAMENRIKALQWAESQAKKKLETTKKLADEKEAIFLQKTRESDEKQHWREALEQQRIAEKLKIDRERTERKQKLHQVREMYFSMKKEQTANLKQKSHRRLEELRNNLKTEQEKKERRRLERTFAHRKMHSALEASDREQRSHVSFLFNNKKETEVKLKMDMQQRIKELEAIELRIIANLKKTYSSHQGEVERFEKIVSGGRDESRSPTGAYVTQKSVHTQE